MAAIACIKMIDSYNVDNPLIRNLSLKDIEGEIWVQLYCSEHYEVSNYGRIKALPREINTRWGSRITKEFIKKQSIIRKNKNSPIMGLNTSIDNKTYQVPRLIYKSFNTTEEICEDNCIMHINKNPLDNRLSNLKNVTRIQSKDVDMRKSIRTIIATSNNVQIMLRKQSEYYNNRTHKQCSKCGAIALIDEFPNNRTTCQSCINKVHVKWRNNKKEKVINGDKKCTKCGKEKPIASFPIGQNRCKECTNTYQRNLRKRNADIKAI